MRIPQPKGHKGSLKWIQEAINIRPCLLSEAITAALGLTDLKSINWLSPLKDDEFAEYRDDAFLDLLSIRTLNKLLKDFWPKKGPQWDALGRTERDEIILVEAKANIPEMISPACGASPASLELIQKSLRETQQFLGVDTNIDWSGKLYQYTNRIAHLYFLRILNQIPAYMVFVYFVGARDVKGPETTAEWKSANAVAKGVLGLGKRHKLSKYMADVFVDVSSFGAG